MSNDPAPANTARGRELLLGRLVQHLGDKGSHDLTLRGLASGVGTSHRMLIYYFGSLDGLLSAVVEETERLQRAALRGLAADPALDLARLADAFWQRLADDRLRPLERLFFQLYSRALGSADRDVAATYVVPWLAPAEALLTERGLEPAEARAAARLGLAVTRGLLLDLLATDDREGVDAAMRMYLRLVDAANLPKPARRTRRRAAAPRTT